jgi:hypothetical protein
MVTAGNGVLSLRGSSGRSYNVSFYSSDVVGSPTTFNLNGLAVAGSQTFYILPENCALEDVSFTSSNTVSTAWVVQINDSNTGNVISIANQLNTLANRRKPMIPLPAGKKFTLIQA